MYYILEIQGLADGGYAHLITAAPTRLQAESEYHRILAAAAVSPLPLHSAALLAADGALLMRACYVHSGEEGSA